MKKKLKNIIKKRNILVKKRFCIKLIITYAVLICLIVIVGIMSYYFSCKAVKSEYKKNSLQAVNMTEQYIDYGLKNVETLSLEYMLDNKLIGYLAGVNNMVDYYRSKRNELLLKVSSSQFINQIYFLTDNVSSLSSLDIAVENSYSSYAKTEQGNETIKDYSNYHWYGQSSVLDNLFNKGKKKSYAIRMTKNINNKKYMAVVDIDKNAILDIINDLDFGKGCYISFVTKDGTELDKNGKTEIVFSSTNFYKNSMSSKEKSGCIENVSYKGKKYMYLYSKIGNTGSSLCVLIENNQIQKKADKIKTLTIVILIIAVIIASLLSGLLTISISSILKRITERMYQISQGDLSVRINLKQNDEFGEMANEIDSMIDGMSLIVSVVLSVSREVIASAKKVALFSQKLSDSSTGISNQMYEIDIGLDNQTKNTTDTLEKMNTLAKHIEKVDTKANDIKVITTHTSEIIKMSIDKMRSLSKKTAATSDITNKVIDSIVVLKEKSNYMGKIIDSINKIADETELLAMNASIESARAGEYGKSFAVVADSITKLAKSTMISIEEIVGILQDISLSTTEAAQIANTAGEYILQQEEASNSLVHTYNQMQNQIAVLMEQMDVIVDSVVKMDIEKENSMQSMDRIATIADEIVCSVSKVNCSTKEEKDMVDSLNEVSEEMKLHIDKLNEAIGKFKI